nr:hypothetical protein B0A51_16159 [Rachicladosporium sp. CCFEE 5018]
MASTEIFALPEILEQILLAMDDMRTLLFSVRVNRHWKAVIANSVKLQEALFFRQVAHASESGRKVVRNPLLLKYGDSGCDFCELHHIHTILCRRPDHPCNLGVHEPASAMKMYLTSSPSQTLGLCVIHSMVGGQGGCMTRAVDSGSTLGEIIRDTADGMMLWPLG